jgi:hypothetical protein
MSQQSWNSLPDDAWCLSDLDTLSKETQFGDPCNVERRTNTARKLEENV